MSFVHLHQEKLSPTARRDAIAAYNLLVERGPGRGGLRADLHYAFARRDGQEASNRWEGTGGPWGVSIWHGPRHRPDGQVAWCTIADLVTAAGPMPVILDACTFR